MTTKFNVRPTRYRELGYMEWGGDWRIIDLTDGLNAAVGDIYRTKAELLADLDRYASLFGCADAAPSERAKDGSSANVVEALRELLEVAALRGDDELPHPADDHKLWTARMQEAWIEARAALARFDAERAPVEPRPASPARLCAICGETEACDGCAGRCVRCARLTRECC